MRATLVILAAGAFACSHPAQIGREASSRDDERCEDLGDGDYRVLELRRPDASLVLFGARHRTSPADPIFARIERAMMRLAPTVVLVEGQGNTVHPTRELAIEHGGEMGFACWLAAQRGVACRDADLTEAEEARRLQRTFTADEVLLFFVVRGLAYFNPRPPEQRPPGDVVEWMIRRDAPLVGLPSATPRDVAGTWERALRRPWDPAAVTTDWHDPRKDELLTQRISREDNALREPFMLEQLLGAAREGARVFGLYGEGHVCNLSARLRAGWGAAEGPPQAPSVPAAPAAPPAG